MSAGVRTATTREEWREMVMALACRVAESVPERHMAFVGWFRGRGDTAQGSVVFEPPDPEHDAFEKWARSDVDTADFGSFLKDGRVWGPEVEAAFRAGRASMANLDRPPS